MAVTGLAKYYNRSPEELSQEEVQRYLLHLLEERKLASYLQVWCTRD